MRPNPPCSRCAVSVAIFRAGGGSLVTEHTHPVKARKEYLDLCPKCYDSFLTWLEIYP